MAIQRFRTVLAMRFSRVPGLTVALQFIRGISRKIVDRTNVTSAINANMMYARSRIIRSPPGLAPDTDSEDEAYIVDDAAFSASEVRRFPEFAGVSYTYVGREFATDFVTQAQTGIEL